MKLRIQNRSGCQRGGRFAVLCVGVASLLMSASPVTASEGEQRASEYGCLNCHSGQTLSSPTLKHLADKLGRKGTGPEAQQHMLRELREHSSIHSHRMVSDESASAILLWLAQGAK